MGGIVLDAVLALACFIPCFAAVDVGYIRLLAPPTSPKLLEGAKKVAYNGELKHRASAADADRRRPSTDGPDRVHVASEKLVVARDWEFLLGAGRPSAAAVAAAEHGHSRRSSSDPRSELRGRRRQHHVPMLQQEEEEEKRTEPERDWRIGHANAGRHEQSKTEKKEAPLVATGHLQQRAQGSVPADPAVAAAAADDDDNRHDGKSRSGRRRRRRRPRRVAVLFKLHDASDPCAKEALAHLHRDLLFGGGSSMRPGDARPGDGDGGGGRSSARRGSSGLPQSAHERQKRVRYSLFVLYDKAGIKPKALATLTAGLSGIHGTFGFNSADLVGTYPAVYPEADGRVVPLGSARKKGLRRRKVMHDNPEYAFLLWWRHQRLQQANLTATRDQKGAAVQRLRGDDFVATSYGTRAAAGQGDDGECGGGSGGCTPEGHDGGLEAGSAKGYRGGSSSQTPLGQPLGKTGAGAGAGVPPWDLVWGIEWDVRFTGQWRRDIFEPLDGWGGGGGGGGFLLALAAPPGPATTALPPSPSSHVTPLSAASADVDLLATFINTSLEWDSWYHSRRLVADLMPWRTHVFMPVVRYSDRMLDLLDVAYGTGLVGYCELAQASVCRLHASRSYANATTTRRKGIWAEPPCAMANIPENFIKGNFHSEPLVTPERYQALLLARRNDLAPELFHPVKKAAYEFTFK